MNTAQLQLLNDLDKTTPEAIYMDKPYQAELTNLGFRQGTVANDLIQEMQMKTVELVMKDGVARQIGLDDTVTHKADIIRIPHQVSIKPFAVQLSSKAIAREISTKELAVAEVIGALDRQKDLQTLNTFEARSVAKPNIAFTLETFAGNIISAVNEQGLALGINQKKSVVLLSENIMIRLLSSNLVGTAENYWQHFISKMGSMQVAVYVTSLNANTVFVMESSLVMEYQGQNPTLRTALQRNEGSVTEEMVDEYTFATNDYIVKKADASWIYNVVDVTGFRNVTHEGKNVKSNDKQVVSSVG
jgi:hypothetical protein